MTSCNLGNTFVINFIELSNQASVCIGSMQTLDRLSAEIRSHYLLLSYTIPQTPLSLGTDISTNLFQGHFVNPRSHETFIHICPC